jgi:acetate kinase
VFTAGIGENSAAIRARIAEKLNWLDVALNPAANESNRPLISRPNSAVSVYVIPTNEELMIARHTLRLSEPSDLSFPASASRLEKFSVGDGC